MQNQSDREELASPPGPLVSEAPVERMRPVEGLALVVLLAFVALIANVLRREFSYEQMLANKPLMAELAGKARQMALARMNEESFARYSGQPAQPGPPRVELESEFSSAVRIWRFVARRSYGSAEWRMELEVRLDPPGECVLQSAALFRPDGRKEPLGLDGPAKHQNGG